MNLEISSKREKRLKADCRNLTKSLSEGAMTKTEVIKPPNISNNGRIYVNKRKYSGDKNPESNC